MQGRALRVVLLIATLCATGVALAQSDPTARETSRREFAVGAAALEDGRASEALAHFERAYALFPHYSTWYNIGLAHRALGQPVDAVGAFQKYLEQGGTAVARGRRDMVEGLIRESRQKIATVRVATVPADAAVTIDGKAVDGGGPHPLNPGEHAIDVTAPGFVAARKTVQLAASSSVVVQVELEAERAPSPPPEALSPRPIAPASASPPRALPIPPSDPPEDRARQDFTPLDTSFWTVTALSGVALVSGTVLGVLALNDASVHNRASTSDEEADRRRSRGEVLRVAADISFGLAIVGGVTAILLAGREAPGEASTPRAAMRAVPLRSGGLLAAEGRF